LNNSYICFGGIIISLAIPENYSYDETSNNDYAQEPLILSDNVIKVLERRYLKKDREGNVIETPNDLFLRVAKSIAIEFETNRGYQ